MFKGNFGQHLGSIRTSRRVAVGAGVGLAMAAVGAEAAPLAEKRGFSDVPAVEMTWRMPVATEIHSRLSAGQILLLQGPEVKAAGNTYTPDNQNQGLTFILVGMDAIDLTIGLSQGTYRLISKQTLSTGRDRFNDALEMGREWAKGSIGENGFSKAGLTLSSKMIVLGAFNNPEAPFQPLGPEIVRPRKKQGLNPATQHALPASGLSTQDGSRMVVELWVPGGHPKYGEREIVTVVDSGVDASVKGAGNAWKYSNADMADVLAEASEALDRKASNPQKVHGFVPYSELVGLGIIQPK